MKPLLLLLLLLVAGCEDAPTGRDRARSSDFGPSMWSVSDGVGNNR